MTVSVSVLYTKTVGNGSPSPVFTKNLSLYSCGVYLADNYPILRKIKSKKDTKITGVKKALFNTLPCTGAIQKLLYGYDSSNLLGNFCFRAGQHRPCFKDRCFVTVEDLCCTVTSFPFSVLSCVTGIKVITVQRLNFKIGISSADGAVQKLQFLVVNCVHLFP